MYNKYQIHLNWQNGVDVRIQNGGSGEGVLTHSGRLQVAIGFHKNSSTCTDPPRDAIGPPWVQLLLEGGPYGPDDLRKVNKKTLSAPLLPTDGIL